MAAKGNAKLLYPGLSDFYSAWSNISFTLVRIVVGVIMIMHVLGKFKLGAGAVAANVMAKNGLEPSMAFAYAAMFLEAVGGASSDWPNAVRVLADFGHRASLMHLARAQPVGTRPQQPGGFCRSVQEDR